MADGGWRIEDGGWRMEDEIWRMEDGGWRMLTCVGKSPWRPPGRCWRPQLLPCPSPEKASVNFFCSEFRVLCCVHYIMCSVFTLAFAQRQSQGLVVVLRCVHCVVCTAMCVAFCLYYVV